MSERYDHYDIQPRGFETLGDLAVRRPSAERIESQGIKRIGMQDRTCTCKKIQYECILVEPHVGGRELGLWKRAPVIIVVTSSSSVWDENIIRDQETWSVPLYRSPAQVVFNLHIFWLCCFVCLWMLQGTSKIIRRGQWSMQTCCVHFCVHCYLVMIRLMPSFCVPVTW